MFKRITNSLKIAFQTFKLSLFIKMKRLRGGKEKKTSNWLLDLNEVVAIARKLIGRAIKEKNWVDALIYVSYLQELSSDEEWRPYWLKIHVEKGLEAYPHDLDQAQQCFQTACDLPTDETFRARNIYQVAANLLAIAEEEQCARQGWEMKNVEAIHASWGNLCTHLETLTALHASGYLSLIQSMIAHLPQEIGENTFEKGENDEWAKACADYAARFDPDHADAMPLKKWLDVQRQIDEMAYWPAVIAPHEIRPATITEVIDTLQDWRDQVPNSPRLVQKIKALQAQWQLFNSCYMDAVNACKNGAWKKAVDELIPGLAHLKSPPSVLRELSDHWLQIQQEMDEKLFEERFREKIENWIIPPCKVENEKDINDLWEQIEYLHKTLKALHETVVRYESKLPDRISTINKDVDIIYNAMRGAREAIFTETYVQFQAQQHQAINPNVEDREKRTAPHLYVSWVWRCAEKYWNIQAEKKTQEICLQADQLRQNNDLANALVQLRKAEALNPNDTNIQTQILLIEARQFWQNKDFKAALDKITKALKDSPRHVEALSLQREVSGSEALANADRHIKNFRFAEAEEALRRAKESGAEAESIKEHDSAMKAQQREANVLRVRIEHFKGDVEQGRLGEAKDKLKKKIIIFDPHYPGIPTVNEIHKTLTRTAQLITMVENQETFQQLEKIASLLHTLPEIFAPVQAYFTAQRVDLLITLADQTLARWDIPLAEQVIQSLSEYASGDRLRRAQEQYHQLQTIKNNVSRIETAMRNGWHAFRRCDFLSALQAYEEAEKVSAYQPEVQKWLDYTKTLARAEEVLKAGYQLWEAFPELPSLFAKTVTTFEKDEKAHPQIPVELAEWYKQTLPEAQTLLQETEKLAQQFESYLVYKESFHTKNQAADLVEKITDLQKYCLALIYRSEVEF